MKHYDGIIIGAGITGCSIAYFLTKNGYSNILVIDKGGIASGVTGICPGGIRQQWGTKINCEMAKFSVDFFENINDHLEPEHEITFRNVGYLYTLHSDKAIENFKKNIKLQNSLGIPTKLISPAEVKEIIPGINENSFIKASYCETDGFLDDAYHTTQSFADAAKRQGATFKVDEVIKIVEENDTVKGIETKKNGLISADFVVNAAGLGAKDIAQTIDIDLPIKFEKRRILYTNRIEERLIEPLLISFEMGFAAKQLTEGSIYLSYLGGDLEPGYSLFDYQVKAAEVGMELFPPLEKVEFQTHLDGTYDSTPDHQAILGDVDHKKGYYQAVGMSGHGCMMSPSVGQAMADIITGSKPVIDVSVLHYNRFKNNELVIEPSVI